MKNENRRVIYDGINMSVRALTLFIVIGLLLMAGLIWYGSAKENSRAGADSAPVRPNDQGYIAIAPSLPTEPCFQPRDTRLHYKSLRQQ
ncbi:MAG: hypothetical protein IJY39_10395 [Clostridia bacterium]|nr:hypothetical protein [Clostridia bacterium]